MIAPKTNWTTEDKFNVVDYSRITANLNELAALHEIPVVSWRAVSAATILTVTSDRERIVQLYNSINNAVGNPCRSLSTNKSFWFNFVELNALESLAALEYIWTHIGLIDSEELRIAESGGKQVYAKNTKKGARVYKSAYTGRQIDLFIGQIKRWNNGEL